MIYEEDAEWTPSHKWRRKHGLEEAAGERPREPANSRRAKMHTLKKTQEIKRAENLLADVDDAAISTSAYETFKFHHELSSVDFSHSGTKSNYCIAANSEVLLPKAPLTLLKTDIINKRKFHLTRPNLCHAYNAKHTTINLERAYHCTIPSKSTSQHHMTKEERITNNKALIKLFQRRNKEGNPRKPSRKRKRVKPRLSVTIPESKLFPKKKHYVVSSSRIMAKQTILKNNETKNKNYLKEMKLRSLEGLRELNRELVAQTKNDKDRKSDITSENYTKKLHYMQLESLSNSELPIGLCNNGSINADCMANSPARRTTNVSYTFDTHFAAIQQFLKNLAVKGNKKAQWIQEQGYGSEEDDGDSSFPKENSIPRCYNIDDKDKPSGKLVLKIRRIPSNPQTEAEISREDENLKITDHSEGNNKENFTTEKNLSLNILKKINESAHTEFGNPIIDVTASKGTQFIDDFYRYILKDITSKMHELLAFRFGTVSEISGNKDFTKANEENENCKSPKGIISSSIIKKPEKDKLSVNNIIYFQGSSCSKNSSRITDVLSAERDNQGCPYELLYEDFTRYYINVFDDDTNAMCSEMGELLEYIVAKEEILFVKQVDIDHNILHSGYFTGNIYNQIGQEKIKYLNNLFLQIYERICDITDNAKQRKILLITWFVKVKSRISSIANRTWTLKETRLHLITFLSQDKLNLPLVGEVFFRQEEAFLQDCMMVVDYTLKCMNSVQESRKEVYKSKENYERTASTKYHHVCTDDQNSSVSTNIVQYPNVEPSTNCPNSMKGILENVQKRVCSNSNVDNLNSTNSIEETCNNGQSEKPLCENELHMGKQSSENISYFHRYEESPCTEKPKEPYHLNICNDSVNSEGKVKKVSTLVQTLYEAHKNSSAERLEKLVEHIRIGDIDLDYASCKIMQILRESGNFDEQYSHHNKIDVFLKRFKTSSCSLSTNESISTSF